MSKHRDRHGEQTGLGRKFVGLFAGQTWETGTAPQHRATDEWGQPLPRPKPEIAQNQKWTDRMLGRKK